MATSSGREHVSAEACSFCEKAADEVARLIAGRSGFICDACVRLCLAVVDAPTGDHGGRPQRLLELWAEFSAAGDWTGAMAAAFMAHFLQRDQGISPPGVAGVELMRHAIDQLRRPRALEDLRCGFCSKPYGEVRGLNAGHGGYICVDCVEMLTETRAWMDPVYRGALVERLVGLADKPQPILGADALDL